MLSKVIGILLLGLIIFIIPIYLLIGIAAVVIYFDRWYYYTQFRRGIIVTPVAVVMGVIFWPWVLRIIWTSRKSIRESESPKEWESLKERIDIILSDDRSKGSIFFNEWVQDYFINPKVDPEIIYPKRIYL